MRNHSGRTARTALLLIAAACLTAALFYAWPQAWAWEDALRLLLGGLLVFALVAALRSSGRARTGLARGLAMEVSEAAPSTRFADVAANEEALASLRSLADALREPERYARLGARPPRGVLLYGPPGTGKTLMARALAGEAGVPFYAVSGSDFVQVYVGVGAARVRELFAKAKKAGRAVIFIDEIDALGKRRDNASSEEREQTLNALLTQMDGFDGGAGVVVLAATNRVDTLDDALLRPGRFDRHVCVGLPGREQRAKILALHAKDKPFEPSVDWDALAQDTVGFSGAKLESLLNEAAIYAAQRAAERIAPKDVRRAFSTMLVGEERAGAGFSERERHVTAVHEAGHALLTLLLMPESRLSQVSIVPSTGGAGGYSMAVPPDSAFLSRAQVLARMAAALGGRAAERIVLGGEEITNGAAGDLQHATRLAASACLCWGMDDDLGYVAADALPDGLADGARARAAVERMLREAMDLAERTLRTRRDALERVSEALLARERMTGEEIREIAARCACGRGVVQSERRLDAGAA